jgi:hypothetical protein
MMLMIICGNRFDGEMVTDPIVKVFDVRTMRQLPGLPFRSGRISTIGGGGPTMLRFLPKFTSTLAVCSPSGLLQLMDAGETIQTDLNYYQIGLDKTLASSMPSVTCMQVASSGQAMAFGDSNGVIHLWADRGDMTVNAFSEPTEWVSPFPDQLDIPITEDTALSMLPLAPSDDSLLSTWTNQRTFRAPKPLAPLDATLIPDLKWKDFIGYAPVPLSAAAALAATNTSALQSTAASSTSTSSLPSSISSLADLKTNAIRSTSGATIMGARNSLALYRNFTASRRAADKSRRLKAGARSTTSFTDALSSSLRSEMTIGREYAKVKINIPKLGLSTFDFRYTHT